MRGRRRRDFIIQQILCPELEDNEISTTSRDRQVVIDTFSIAQLFSYVSFPRILTVESPTSRDSP